MSYFEEHLDFLVREATVNMSIEQLLEISMLFNKMEALDLQASTYTIDAFWSALTNTIKERGETIRLSNIPGAK